MKINTGQFFKT